jgi:hypothetical protein
MKMRCSDVAAGPDRRAELVSEEEHIDVDTPQ